MATIVASNGKTLSEYTWTNEAALTGSSPLTFSTNYNKDQGIGFTSVTINATGSGVVFSRYITTCQQTTELILTPDNEQQTAARKLIIGGRIYILIGDQLYNIQGQRIK